MFKGDTCLLNLPGISEKFEARKVNWLQLHYILSDAGHDDIIQRKINSNNVVNGVDCSIDLSDEELSLRDVDCLIFFIQNFDSIMAWNSINLCGCKLGDKGCGTLCQALHVICNCKNIIIKSLNISGNKLKSPSLSDVGNTVKILKIKELIASNNVFTNGEFSSFADSELERLDLSSNHLQSCDIVQLCQALRRCKNLKHLSLNNNHISDRVITELIISIEKWNDFLLFNSDDPYINDLLLFVKRKLLHVKYANEITFNDTTVDIRYFIKFLQYTKDVSDAASDFIYNITKILSLSLQCNECAMTENEHISLTVSASEFFVKFRNLSILNLSGIHIDGQAANSLANAFKCVSILQTLEHLTMNGCHLNSNNVAILVQALYSSNKIKEFHACDNLLCDKATEALTIAILHWKSLKTLYIFNGNYFTESSKFLLNLLLLDTCDKVLDQSLCISNSTVEAFLAILANLTTSKSTHHPFFKNASKIIKVSVNCTFPNTFQLSTGAGKLIKYFECLQELSICGLSFAENSAIALANALQVKSTTAHPLKILKLINCQLNSDFISQLLSPNKKNSIDMLKSLQEIDFSCNDIDDCAVYSIVTSILQMPYLTEILMNDNPFSQYDVKMIIKIINDCKHSISVITYDSDEQVSAFISLLSFMHDVESTKSCQVTNISMITELNLHYHHRTEILSENAVLFFTRFTKLTKLNLTGIRIKSGAVNILADCLANNLGTLKELRLSHCQLDYHSIVTILHYEKKSTTLLFNTLKKLNFDHNHITKNAMKPLLISVFKMPNLTLLSIDGNPLKSKVIKIAFGILLELKISEQVYANKDYSVDHVNAFLLLLSSAVNVSSSISLPVHNMINLKKLTITCSSCAILTRKSALFFKRFVELEELNFSGFYIESKVINIIANALSKRLHSLKVLQLSRCQLDSKSTLILLCCYQKPPPKVFDELTELDLSKNNIESSAIPMVISSLLQMTKLRKINFEDNKLTNSDMKAIDSVISEFNCSKALIDYSNAELSVNAFLILLEGMKTPTVERSSQIRNIINIKKLYLDCFKSRKPLMLTKNASLFLQNLKCLRELSLSGIHIKIEAIKEISDALNSKLRLLQVLKLSRCKLNSYSAIELLSSCNLANLLDLKELDLSYNNIKDDAVYSIIESLLQIPKSVKVNLDGNPLSESNILAISRITSDFNYCISTIDYSDRPDKDIYISSLFTILASMKNISDERSYQVKNILSVTKIKLICSDNKIPIVMTKDVASFFKRLTNLQELNLGGVCIEYNSAIALQNALQCYSLLESLILNNCGLDSDFIIAIVSSLHKDKLRELCLSQNECINYKAMCAIYTFIHNNKTLCVLNLSSNGLKDNEAIVLSDGLVHCKGLQHLDLSNNKMNDIGVSKLLTAFLQIDALRKLQFENNAEEKIMKIAFNIMIEMRTPQASYTTTSDDGVKAFLTVLSSAVNISPNNSRSVQHLTKLKRLKMQCLGHVMLTAESSAFFEKFDVMEEIKICGLLVEPNAITKIADTLSKNLHTLKVLCLSNCRLDSNSAIILLCPYKVSVLLELTELDLSYNNIKDDAIYSIIESLLQIPKSVKVNLDGNPLSESNILAISRITSDFNSCISTIDYSDRPDKDIYISSLFTILASMKNVSDKRSYQVKNILAVTKVKLICSDNKIPIVMTKDVASCFSRLTNLQELNLSGVCIEYNSAIALENALKYCSSLESLILNNCGLNSNFIIAIVSSLHKDKLRELCLSQNECINYKAACAINTFIHNNKTLCVLNLSSNGLKDNEAIVLSDGLVHCKSLQRLDLSNNKILTDIGVSKLLTAFLQIDALRKLQFENNAEEKIMKIAFNIIIEMRTPQASYTTTSDDGVKAFLTVLSSAVNISPNNSRSVQHLTKLKRLKMQCLDHVMLTAESSAFFEKFDVMEEIKICGLLVEPNAITKIADTLSKNLHTLKVLCLSNCRLDSNSAIILLCPYKVSVLLELTELDLSYNNIKDDAVYSVVELLLQIPKLKKVNFDGNPLSESNMLAISSVTSNFNTGKVPLNYNTNLNNDSEAFHTLLSSAVNISKGRSHQVESIKKAKELILQCSRYFEMSNNFSLFVMKFDSLHTLEIDGIHINLKAICNIAKALESNLVSLIVLSLNRCNLRAIGSIKVANGLKNCKNLRRLDLAYNKITDEAAETLIKVVKRLYHYGLENLNIENNELSHSNMTKIKSEVYWSAYIFGRLTFM